jgi:hypothetical protein
VWRENRENRVIDDHMDELFYTGVLVEDEKAREEFQAFAREQERFAGMTNDQFRKLFREKFGREWNDHEPILAARSEEEYEFLLGYISGDGEERQVLMTEEGSQATYRFLS